MSRKPKTEAKKDEEGRKLAKLDFLLSENRFPSAIVFESMAGNPLMAEVAARKKFSYRELVIIANTVIGGLDNEVIRLRRFERGILQMLGTAINQPLFLPALSFDSSKKVQAEGKDDSAPDFAEIHWFVKYLTLRNILGVVVVIISLSAGFFAWFNKDYRSLLDAKNERVVEANQRTDEAKAKATELERKLAVKITEFEGQTRELARLRGDLTTFDKENASLQAQLKEINAKRTEVAGSEAQQLLAKEKEVGYLNTKLAEVEGRIKTVETERDGWKKQYDDSQKTIFDKNADVKSTEQKLAEAKGQRDNAVNAWNDFMGYLYEKDKWGEIRVSTDLVKQKLRNLESKTSAVEGMKSVLQ